MYVRMKIISFEDVLIFILLYLTKNFNTSILSSLQYKLSCSLVYSRDQFLKILPN